MNFAQKAKHYTQEMDYLGISKDIAAPLLYRFLWAFGIEEKPPLFSSRNRVFSILTFYYLSLLTTVYAGLSIAVGFAAVEYLLIYFLVGVLSALLAFLKSIRYEQEAAALELPEWEVYLSNRT